MPRLTELPGKPSYPGRANFSYVSLENAPKRLHAKQGNPPCRGTLSPCPGHPSRRAIFCHLNGSSRLAEVRGPRYISRQLLMLTASGDYAQLVECKLIALDTEKRPLAERVIKKKIKLTARKTFLLSAILFAVISGPLD